MTAPFYASQPPSVRAVLDLAALAPELDADTFAGILDTFAPEHADAIRELADTLKWIDRLSWEDPATALRSYHGDASMRFVGADQVADELSARLQAEALLAAQLVASVLSSARAVA